MAEIKENTHIVLKLDDVKKFLVTKQDFDAFIKCLKLIDQGLVKENRSHDYWVCNKDEPYADEVIRIILAGEDMKDRFKLRQKNLDSVKEALAYQLQALGYEEDISIDENNKTDRKLFAFKINDLERIEQSFINEKADFIIAQICELFKDCTTKMSFNVAKIETIRDSMTFSDLVRGVIYFREQESENV